MQYPVSKNLLFISIFFFSIATAIAQQTSYRLQVADSLFKNKRYTQSFEQYQEILNQRQYTPAMLLHMAYIQEGLNHIGQAMYYLNFYFKVTNDKSALIKMEQMAAKYHLEGYETDDSTWMLTFYHDYRKEITIFLVALSIFLISLAFYNSVKLKRKPIAGSVSLMAVLIALGVHINLEDFNKSAVVAQNNTYIMTGPSAGASVRAIVNQGHRLKIKGHTDVWLRIEWEGEEAFVKDNKLMAI